MKINLMKLAAILALTEFAHTAGAGVTSVKLHDGWQFRQERSEHLYPATVPGVVHTDLMAAGIIEDPFFRLNERGVQWIDKEDWVYQTVFDVDADLLAKDFLRLNFDGLDTYADVYLNGEKIIVADNMHRRWNADVKALLKPAGNELRVYFHSPIKIDMPKWEALPYQYQAINDQSQNGGLLDRKLSVFARKAGYHYGWDWGPRLVTSGIWRDVTLEGWDKARIDDVFVRQDKVDRRRAVLTQVVEIAAGDNMADVTVNVYDNSNGKKLGGTTHPIGAGLNTVEVGYTIPNPRLWWSNGLGKPDMYELRTDIVAADGTVLDSKVTPTGLRSIEVVREEDADGGRSFYFKLNGVPVFAKGANYIPSDNFLPRVSREKYRRTLLDASEANMNMLRVWGGGVYEDDYFYHLCDSLGLMVWQDFMFACSLYPAEGALLENIKAEAADNIRRLRNHPSIVLWCGNNEIYDAWEGWGWQQQYAEANPEYTKKIDDEYNALFHKALPEEVAKHCPGAFYWPSSPWSRYNGTSENNRGDTHYWGVWHAKEPISKYNEVRSRFFSEYGFQSFPEFESLKLYAPDSVDWSIDSEVMMSHQRGGSHANGLINAYLLDEYREPKDFESFLYLNHVLQGDAVKTAIEAHRRDKPYCMGTLFWQHNDCWPVASWSSRDYYGRWKAQHYFSRKAYDDILVSPISKNGKLEVYVVSDRPAPARGALVVEAYDLDGKIVKRSSKKVNVPANSSNSLWSCTLADFTGGLPENAVIIAAAFTDDSGKEYTNNYYPAKQKDIDYPEVAVRHTVTPAEGGYELSVWADKPARAVFLAIDGIDNFFSDNYFDLLPGQTKTVHVSTDISPEEFDSQLRIMTISDAY